MSIGKKSRSARVLTNWGEGGNFWETNACLGDKSYLIEFIGEISGSQRVLTNIEGIYFFRSSGLRRVWPKQAFWDTTN